MTWSTLSIVTRNGELLGGTAPYNAIPVPKGVMKSLHNIPSVELSHPGVIDEFMYDSRHEEINILKMIYSCSPMMNMLS